MLHFNAFRQPNAPTAVSTSAAINHPQESTLGDTVVAGVAASSSDTVALVGEGLAAAPALYDQYKAALLENAIRLAEPAAAPNNSSAATRVRTAAQRLLDASDLPPLQQLFGSLWETPGIAILFGDTGIGKSILAVHIAHLITSANTELLGQTCQLTEQVLYYDFELSDRQFDKRFAGLPFTDLLLLGDTNPTAEDVEAFTFDHIVADLNRTGARFIILDNVTALVLTSSTADAEVSISIMKGLKRLQTERGVASLVLAHTPKILPGQPLSLNHLAGSKHLSNFADSVFCIARSAQASQRRYLKQLKNRTAEEMPDVLVCDLSNDAGYVEFTLVGVEEERHHLAALSETPATRPPAKAPAQEVLRQLPDFLQEPQASGILAQSLADSFQVSSRIIQDRLAELLGAHVVNTEGVLCCFAKKPAGRETHYFLQEMAQAA